ncbi:MAG: hypothetical protein JEZ12_24880 [Desulfobacterium sp.]|nr:hypothetical protein [Desulfobacterium sp.]
MTFKDQMKQDLDVFFNLNEFAEEIHWDNDTVVVVVEDMESQEGDEIGTRIERKKVEVRQASIKQRPVSGDQVRLNFDPGKVDLGDYWTVDSVAEPPGTYGIVFYRYVS